MKDKEYKLAICISGGLDSFTAIQYAKHVVCPHFGWDFLQDVILIEVFDKTNPYGEKEAKIINEMYRNNQFPYVHRVELNGYTELVSTDSHVVLGRNAVIASIAAGVAPLVWINGTAYENNGGMYDKNTIFFYHMSNTMTYACRYTRKGQTVIGSPFQGDNLYIEDKELELPNWEKPDMITYLESIGETGWRFTTSCFHTNANRCGDCVVCGKRFVYEVEAEIRLGQPLYDRPIEQTFLHDVLQNTHLNATLVGMLGAVKAKDYQRYDKERVKIYARVMSKYNNVVAMEIKSLLEGK